MGYKFQAVVPGLALMAVLGLSFLLLGNQQPVIDQQPVTRPALTAMPRRPAGAISATATPTTLSELEQTAPTAVLLEAQEEINPAQLFAFDPPLPQVISHTISAGETLSSIADQYETTVEQLQALNGLIDPNHLLVGQTLNLPGPGDSALLATPNYQATTLGQSAGGQPLVAYSFGAGPHEVVLIGAIHGGYEWNTAVLAYQLMTYFTVYPERLPADVQLQVIPIANPDGTLAVVGQSGPFMAVDVQGDTTLGRFNANGVDLNRNWGCNWQAEGVWGFEVVSGGERPFSEPENQSLRDYFLQNDLAAVIWLHSAAGLVAPGSCAGVLHEASEEAARLYAEGAGYPVGGFNAYQVTGDAADWLAQHDIPSFSVELTDHEESEFGRNLAGLLTLLNGIDALEASGDEGQP